MPFFIAKVADEVELGDFKAALKTLTSGAVKAFEELPAWLQTFIGKLGGQEQTILDGLVTTASSTLLGDVTTASQLTTAEITEQAKNIYQQLVTQNISTFTLQDVFSALNSALSSSLTSSSAMAATDADPVDTTAQATGG